MARPQPAPSADERRLAALHETAFLDRPSEDLFDSFAELAARLCGVPFALVGLVDRDGQWFTSAIGLEAGQAELGAFCALVERGGVSDVPDLAGDARFAQSALVRGEPAVRFYGGVELRSGGELLGILGIMDRAPGRLRAEQRMTLVALGEAVTAQCDARRALLRQFERSDAELFHVDLDSQRVAFASDAACRNLGYTIDELRMLPFATLLPLSANERRFAERLAELRMSPRGRLAVRTIARRKDGTTFPVELRMELLTTRRRQIALVVATDLTASEGAQRQIELLSAAMESAPDAIVIAELGEPPENGSKIVFVNHAFLALKGATSRAELIGRRIDEFLGPRTDLERIAELREAVLSGRPAQAEYVSYRPDGSCYHVETSVRPLADENGRTTHYVAVQRDVTESVLRDAHLTMQNEHLTAITSIARTLFASLEPSMLVETLLTGVDVLLDGAATLYAPRPRGGFASTTDFTLREDAQVGDEFVALASHSDVCILDASETRAAVRVPGSGGGTAFVLDVRRTAPLTSAEVFALGLLGQYFAVAARNVELYRELASRRDAVVELNQVKNDLIAMLAHDFKGPLTSIVGFADVLADDARLDAESRQYLGMISSSALRLASLATDTLALSRLERNELTLTPAEVDLVALVRDVVRVFSVTRVIDLRVGGDGRLGVLGDAARLRQVVENLVGNAIKYSPGGEPVELALRARPGGVELLVRDRGIGIPELERPKLFGRFARASNARALGIGGTGFGLFLSKTIVELHGGTIEVESTEGQGSAFRVFIPSRPSLAAVAHARIALLDPEGDARSYVAQALRGDGYFVSVATSADDLLRILGEASFDVALVDADRLGMQVATFLAQAGSIPLVRIGVRTPAAHEGWSAVLTKPFLMKDLYDAVDAALDHTNGGLPSARTRPAGSS